MKLSWVFLLFPLMANAETLATVYPVEVLDVVDGDTIKVKATIWLKTYKETAVRVYGIDTPEIKGQCELEKDKAQQAKTFVESALANADNVFIQNISNDKYGNRVVAEVLYENNGVRYVLGDELIKNKLAIKYQGKTKTHNWCEK